MAKRTTSPTAAPATVRAPKIPPPTRPVACHACGARDVRVESDTDYAQRLGRRRVTATCICQQCGHRWTSVHPAAVKRARELARGTAPAAS